MLLTKSLAETIRVIDANGLSVFIDDRDGLLKVKDVNGRTADIASLVVEAVNNGIFFDRPVTLHDPDTESVVLQKAFQQLTIHSIYASAKGTDPQISFNIYFGEVEDVADGAVFLQDKILTSSELFTQFDTAIIPANKIIWFRISELSGSNLKVHATVNFKKA